MGTTLVNGLVANAPVVNTFGGNTTTVSNGSTTFVWNDKNGDGKVSNGDVIARTRQGDGSVLQWHVGEDEGMMVWGDPHIDNVKFSEKGKKATVEALDSMFQDAKDGKLDKGDLFTEAEAVSRANVNKQERTLIMGTKADMSIQMGAGSKMALDVEKSDIGVTVDNVDLTLTDAAGNPLVLKIGRVWGGRGGDGKQSVEDVTGKGPSLPAKAPTFYELAGANLSNKTRFYGADYGTNPFTDIVTEDGVRRDQSRGGPAAYRYYDEAVVKQDQETMLKLSQSLAGVNTDWSNYVEDLKKNKKMADGNK